jgi:hypothetical protein
VWLLWGERLELVEQLRSNFLYTERASKIVGFDLLLACCSWDSVTMAYFLAKEATFIDSVSLHGKCNQPST